MITDCELVVQGEEVPPQSCPPSLPSTAQCSLREIDISDTACRYPLAKAKLKSTILGGYCWCAYLKVSDSQYGRQ